MKKRQEPFFWKERRHLVGGSRASCSRCKRERTGRDAGEPHAGMRALRHRALLLRRHLTVQLHDFQSHLGGRVHVLDVQPFFDRVNRPHAGAEVGALDSTAIENVRVAAAA